MEHSRCSLTLIKRVRCGLKQVIEIAESGFAVIFETWDDTGIARMHTTWKSIGEASDPDEIWNV